MVDALLSSVDESMFTVGIYGDKLARMLALPHGVPVAVAFNGERPSYDDDSYSL